MADRSSALGRSMRVALVAPEFPPAIGGMQTYALETARELSRRGVDVTVFAKGLPMDSEPPGVGVVVRQVEGRLVHDREWVRAQAEAFDLWHVMNSAYSWIALEVAAPVVVTVYGNDILNPNPVAGFDLRQRLKLPFGSRLDLSLARWRTPRLIGRALRRVAHVIAISRFTESLLLEKYPECRGRSSVGYVGVGAEFLSQPRSQKVEQTPRLLTVARLSEPRKNVGLVLRALAGLKEEFNFTYQVVGDGVEQSDLIALTKQLGLADRAKFLGCVPASSLPELYASSDLFVLTSSAAPDSVEGFGLVYLEANACGTPVLAADQGGASEAVSPGVSGFFVEEPNERAVAEALRRFLEGRIAFSAQDCRDFAAKFSWQAVGDHTLNCYSQLLSSR